MFKNNMYKKGLQWLIVAMLGYMVIRLFVDPNYIADFEAYCPVGGMQAFASFMVNNTLACTMTETQIFMGIVLIAWGWCCSQNCSAVISARSELLQNGWVI